MSIDYLDSSASERIAWLCRKASGTFGMAAYDLIAEIAKSKGADERLSVGCLGGIVEIVENVEKVIATCRREIAFDVFTASEHKAETTPPPITKIGRYGLSTRAPVAESDSIAF